MKRRAKPQGAKKSKEMGAVAVEFALILPVFLMLIMGVVEFGRAFGIQISMAQGAREAARYMAIHYTDADAEATARDRAIFAANPIADLQPGEVTIGGCTPGPNTIVTITADRAYLTGLPTLLPFLPDTLKISARGVMQCGG